MENETARLSPDQGTAGHQSTDDRVYHTGRDSGKQIPTDFQNLIRELFPGAGREPRDLAERIVRFTRDEEALAFRGLQTLVTSREFPRLRGLLLWIMFGIWRQSPEVIPIIQKLWLEVVACGPYEENRAADVLESYYGKMLDRLTEAGMADAITFGWHGLAFELAHLADEEERQAAIAAQAAKRAEVVNE